MVDINWDSVMAVQYTQNSASSVADSGVYDLYTLPDMSKLLTTLPVVENIDLGVLVPGLDLRSVYLVVPNGSDPRCLGLVQEADSQRRNVIVEWRHRVPSQEILAQLGRLAEFSKPEKIPRGLRILQFLGILRQPSGERYGLVWAEPSIFHGRSHYRPFTLTEAFTIKGQRGPSLDENFILVHALAMSVLTLHQLGWVHKAISSYNIIFFSAQASPVDWLRPYLIGPLTEDVEDMDLMNDRDADIRDYYPPYLRASGHSYNSIHDYYSLGIVLLEIGFWRPLKEIAREHSGDSSEDLQKWIIEMRLPLLRYNMGDRYSDVVEACLRKNGDSSVENISSRTAGIEIGQYVVSRLAQHLRE